MGSVLGNVAGGVIGGFLHWKWVLWITAVSAALVAVAAYVVAPQGHAPPRHQSIRSVDWLGAGLICAALVLLLVSLSEGNVVGWRTGWVIALLALSMPVAAAFVYW